MINLAVQEVRSLEEVVNFLDNRIIAYSVEIGKVRADYTEQGKKSRHNVYKEVKK